VTIPLLSVITAVGREDRYLKNAAESVAELFEILGDGMWILSSDTVDLNWILKNTRAVGSNRHVLASAHKRPWGPGRVRNRALGRVDSPLVGSLDSDDMYHPAEMAKLVERASTVNASTEFWWAGQTIEVAESGVEYNSSHGYPNVDEPHTVSAGYMRTTIESTNWLPFHCSATLVRSDVLKEIGGWDTSRDFLRVEDIATWIRVTDRYPGFLSPDTVLSRRITEEAITRNPDWGDFALPDLSLIDLPHESSSEDFLSELKNTR